MTLSIANLLKLWPLRKLSWKEFNVVQSNISIIYNLAAIMKGTEQSLLRHDLIKVIKRPWPDLTLTPWFLVYRNIYFALLAVGFTSILDEITTVDFTSFQTNSDRILKLCSDSLLARSRFNDGANVDQRSLKNPISAMRRELKCVFGIKLNLLHVGRTKAKRYNLSFPMDLIEFASSSTLFQDATLPPVIRVPQPVVCLKTGDKQFVPISQEFLHCPPKGRKTGICVLNNVTYNIVD